MGMYQKKRAFLRKNFKPTTKNQFLSAMAAGAQKALYAPAKKNLQGQFFTKYKSAEAIDRAVNTIKKAFSNSSTQTQTRNSSKKNNEYKLYIPKRIPGNVMGGPLVRRFRKGTGGKYRDACILRRERGATYDDPNCVYIGHGMPVNELYKQAWRAVVKKLFELTGNRVQSIERDPLVDSGDTADLHQLFIEFWVNQKTTTSTSFTVNIAVSDTVVSIADKIITAVQTAFSAVADHDVPHFRRIRYITTDVATGLQKQFVAQMFLEDFHLDIMHKSTLRMQNITLAGNVSAPEANEDIASKDNLEAVALRGKCYKTDTWQNGFQLPYKITQTTGDTSLQAEAQLGVILNKYDNLKTTGTSMETYSKPPPAYLLGTKSYANVVSFNPGKIRVDKINFETTMKFNKFIQLIKPSIRSGDWNQIHKIGIAHLFAFEKALDFRTTDSPIILGYEVDYTLSVNGTLRKPKQVPLVNID